MTKFFPYFTLLGLTMLAFRIALVWNIPVKNQMAMALFGCLSFALVIILIIVDISEFIRIRKELKIIAKRFGELKNSPYLCLVIK